MAKNELIFELSFSLSGGICKMEKSKLRHVLILLHLIFSAVLIIFIYMLNSALFKNVWILIALFIYPIVFLSIIDVIAPKRKRDDNNGNN